MEDKRQGYRVKEYHGPVKRYCQTLSLRDDSKLIAEYRRRHSEGAVWPETLAAIREVGILEKECDAGCLGCTKCVKECPENAISMDNFAACVDYNKCNGCGRCVSVCPNDTIKLLNQKN